MPTLVPQIEWIKNRAFQGATVSLTMSGEMQERSLESPINIIQDGTDLKVVLSGPWTIAHGMPVFSQVKAKLDTHQGLKRLVVHGEDVSQWDSVLLVFLDRLGRFCRERRLELTFHGFPEGVERLMKLASAVSRKETAEKSPPKPFVERMGREIIQWFSAAGEMVDFVGQATIAFGKLFRGKARLRRSDLLVVMQECGVNALPIVGLISVLVGLIFAFVGAVQLRMFGAQIFVADLVALAMTREMAGMMTGIIMAGRTGAAFAAQLGTMQVNEEIDAFRTFGIVPMEFLVLPRMLALVLMMPMLYLYSNFLGILGGAVVGTTMLDLPWMQYLQQTKAAVSLTDFFIGFSKSAVFGMLVAFAGCLRGMQCGRSASAVGQAATSAVVTGIVWIIIADSIVAVITSIMGI